MMKKLTIEDLKKMRESAKKDIYLRQGPFRGKVTIHMGTCGIAAGAREIMTTLLEEAQKRNIADIMYTSTGCAGLCSEEPIITVEMGEDPPVKYGKLTAEKARKIFEDHILGGKAVAEFVLGVGSERAG